MDTDQIQNNLNIVWIHGANQTKLSFSFLYEKTYQHNPIFIEYSDHRNFFKNLKLMKKKLCDLNDLHIIGHSMGGLYALHLLNELSSIKKVISISTPFRGSSAADWLRYLYPNYNLFKDVGRKSEPIIKGHEIQINIPWTQIVTTAGCVSYIATPNDGTVTLGSMKHRQDSMKLIYIPKSHHEILLSKETVNIINETFFNTT